MFRLLSLAFLATVALGHGDRPTYTKICGGMRRGVSVFYKGIATSNLFSLTLYSQRDGKCNRRADFSNAPRPFFAAHLGHFPMDYRKNNTIFLGYGGAEGKKFTKASYFEAPEEKDDGKFTIEVKMINDSCALYKVDKIEVGEICNRYFSRDANCMVSSNGVDIRRHYVKGIRDCSQEADDRSSSNEDDDDYRDRDDDDDDDRSDDSRSTSRRSRSRSKSKRRDRRGRKNLDSLERKIRRIVKEELKDKQRRSRRYDSDSRGSAEDSREIRVKPLRRRG